MVIIWQHLRLEKVLNRLGLSMNAVLDFPLQLIANVGCSASATMDWGESAPTKPDWLIKGKHKRKPRPTPGISNGDYRSFYRYDVAACAENMLAVAMLGHLRFWYEQGYDECACSLDFWMQQFGITSRFSVRTAVKALMASGKVERAEVWFNGNITHAYRLTKAAAEEMAIRRSVGNSTPGSAENSTPITVGTEQGCTEKNKSNSSCASLAKTPASTLLSGEDKTTPEVVKEGSAIAQSKRSSNKYVRAWERATGADLSGDTQTARQLRGKVIRICRTLQSASFDTGVPITPADLMGGDIIWALRCDRDSTYMPERNSAQFIQILSDHINLVTAVNVVLDRKRRHEQAERTRYLREHPPR